jgi:quinolinate synthase
MNPRTYVLSTEGMVKHAASSPTETFLVATETGILHRLRKEIPGREFVAADDGAVCGYMKQITLEKVRATLRELSPTVEIPQDIAAKARVAIDRMLAVHV